MQVSGWPPTTRSGTMATGRTVLAIIGLAAAFVARHLAREAR
jgi:hypothetical protein